VENSEDRALIIEEHIAEHTGDLTKIINKSVDCITGKTYTQKKKNEKNQEHFS